MHVFVHASLPPRFPGLFSEAEGLNECPIAIDILRLQIVQQPPSLAHQFQQSPSGMMIFLVDFKMLIEIADTVSQQSDLHLRRPGIGLVKLEPVNQLILCFCG